MNILSIVKSKIVYYIKCYEKLSKIELINQSRLQMNADEISMNQNLKAYVERIKLERIVK